MKTKILFLTMLIGICYMQVSATTYHLTVTANNTTNVIYRCDSPNDTIILHAHAGATSIRWQNPNGDLFSNQDSVIVTYQNQGTWRFRSTQTNNQWKVIIAYVMGTPPYTPTTMDNDTTFCQFDLTIDAQNAESGSTYLWDDNSTNRYRTVSTIGTYSVTITNVCGTTNASVNITANPNSANLGPDQTVCYGEVITLDPGVANRIVTSWGPGNQAPTRDVDTTGTYHVYVRDLNGCESRDTINITTTLQPRIEMCDVSYDTITDRNQINWFVLPSADIDNINIWVKNNMGIFENIETVPYTDGSYIHWGSTPQADVNEYYITGTNDCGEGPIGTINKSIWLTTLDNELQWQNYQGSFVPLYYLVFAKHLNGNVEVIDTIPACSAVGCINHAPIINDPTIAKYFVGFQHDCLSLNKTTPGWVISNYFIAIPDAIAEQEIKFSLSPNPATNEIKIQISYSEFEVKIYDIIGQVLLVNTNTKVLDISSLTEGIYIISITADGKTTNQKVVKN